VTFSLQLSGPQFTAVWEALAQYVENTREAGENEELDCKSYALLKKKEEAAEQVLARFDAEVARQAEEKEVSHD